MTVAPAVGLWAVALLWLVAAVGRFAARRRPAALRLRSLGYGALAAVAARAVLAVAGHPFEAETDWPLYLAAPLAGSLFVAHEVWLVRSSIAELREKVKEGCEGLMIQVGPEGGGRLEISARGVRHVLLLQGLGPALTLAALPGPRSKGKAGLLINWLCKQYPGPFPRPRIRLKRRQ